MTSIETSLKLTPGVVPAGVWCWDKVELDYDSIMISISSASMFLLGNILIPMRSLTKTEIFFDMWTRIELYQGMILLNNVLVLFYIFKAQQES